MQQGVKGASRASRAGLALCGNLLGGFEGVGRKLLHALSTSGGCNGAASVELCTPGLVIEYCMYLGDAACAKAGCCGFQSTRVCNMGASAITDNCHCSAADCHACGRSSNSSSGGGVLSCGLVVVAAAVVMLQVL